MVMDRDVVRQEMQPRQSSQSRSSGEIGITVAQAIHQRGTQPMALPVESVVIGTTIVMFVSKPKAKGRLYESLKQKTI